MDMGDEPVNDRVKRLVKQRYPHINVEPNYEPDWGVKEMHEFLAGMKELEQEELLKENYLNQFI